MTIASSSEKTEDSAVLHHSRSSTTDTTSVSAYHQVEAFFETQQSMTAILMGWAAGSMVIGALWTRQSNKILRGIGIQFFTWGAIDGLLAWFGLRNGRKDTTEFYSNQLTVNDIDKKARNLRRILWFNFVLDITYMLFGRRMMTNTDLYRRGSGIGVFIQGAFLFIFDAVFADSIKPPKQDI